MRTISNPTENFYRVMETQSRLKWVERWAGGEKLLTLLDLAVKRKKVKGQYLQGDMTSCFI